MSTNPDLDIQKLYVIRKKINGYVYKKFNTGLYPNFTSESLFRLFDVNNDSRISLEEFVNGVRDILKISKWYVKDEDVHYIFQFLDICNIGSVNLDEFHIFFECGTEEYFARKLKRANSRNIRSIKNLEIAVDKYASEHREEDWEQLFWSTDKDLDGSISFDEFFDLMRYTFNLTKYDISRKNLEIVFRALSSHRHVENIHSFSLSLEEFKNLKCVAVSVKKRREKDSSLNDTFKRRAAQVNISSVERPIGPLKEHVKFNESRFNLIKSKQLSEKRQTDIQAFAPKNIDYTEIRYNKLLGDLNKKIVLFDSYVGSTHRIRKRIV